MISIRSFLCRLHNFYLHFQTISMEVIILQGQLSQKEKMLLEDLKKEEDLCVKKYSSYAQQAQCPQLSQLFTQIANVEKEHYNTVNQIIQSGGQSAGQQKQGSQGPQSGQKQGSQTWQAGQSSGSKQTNQAAQGMPSSQSFASPGSEMNQAIAGAASSNSDKYMLDDMLSTEKYVASAYNTGIFESAQPAIRQALQHIQQEEQHHGEQLFQYMNSHGMYQVQ